MLEQKDKFYDISNQVGTMFLSENQNEKNKMVKIMLRYVHKEHT